MNQKQTTILGFATLIAVLAALWLMFGEDCDGNDIRGARLLPDLSDRINDLATIRIDGAYVSTTLERAETGWRIVEKAGHPADIEKVQTLLGSLLQAEIERRTTSDPARYDRIGLGEAATQLLLEDGAGERIAGLAVGKRRYTAGSFRSYVRLLPQAQTYLVNDLAELRTDASDWLPGALLELARSRVAGVDIELASGTGASLARDTDSGSFRLADLRDDETFTGQRAADRTVTAYTTLRIDDVRPAGEVTENAEPMAVATLRTYDGLTLALSLYDTGDETGDAWATLRAAYAEPDPDAMPDRVENVPPDGEAEASALNARTEDWAYRLSASAVLALMRQRDELVETQAAEAEEGEAQP